MNRVPQLTHVTDCRVNQAKGASLGEAACSPPSSAGLCVGLQASLPGPLAPVHPALTSHVLCRPASDSAEASFLSHLPFFPFLPNLSIAAQFDYGSDLVCFPWGPSLPLVLSGLKLTLQQSGWCHSEA